MLFLFIVIGAVLFSVIFRYPDTISAPFKLTSSTPPTLHSARSTGKIIQIFYSSLDTVAQGDELILIESPTNYDEVKSLQGYITELRSTDWDSLARPPKPHRLMHLGEMQPLYASLSQAIYAYDAFCTTPYYRDKKSSLRAQIQTSKSRQSTAQKREGLKEAQLTIIGRQVQRDSLLHAKGLTSAEELETAQYRHLSSQDEHWYSKLATEDIQHSIEVLNGSIIDLDHEYQRTKDGYIQQVRTLLSQLEASLLSWELRYLVRATSSGQVVSQDYWAINQEIQEGTPLLSIIPNKPNLSPIAHVFIPMHGAGKVKVGQRVHLHCSSFPRTEYGLLVGAITKISPLPVSTESGSFYNVEVGLSNGLETSYGKVLPYFLNLEGEAEIITDDLTLMQRMLAPIRKLFDNNQRP